MEGKLEAVKNYFVLIKEGAGFKDRLNIFAYFLSTPIHFIYSIVGKNYVHEFRENIKIKNEDGIFYTGKSTSTAWIAGSFHEKNMKKFFTLKEGVFVDIGAHIGKFTIRIARMLGENGKVIAIEPSEYNFNLLRKNIKLNNLQNVTAFNVACSDKDGVSRFYLGEKGSGGHSFTNTKGAEEVEVKTKKLDTLTKKLKLKRIDLIKIDVEGAELKVINGALKTLKKYHPKIIFECWDNEQLDKVKKILEKMKYRVKELESKNYMAY